MAYRKTLINIVVVFALTIGSYVCLSSSIQEVEIESYNATLIKPNTFTIHNHSNNSMFFYLSYDDGKSWSENKLDENQIYDYSNNTLGRVMIKVPTQKKGSVRYWLETNKRYQIYWNNSQQIWDVTELRAR